MTVALIIIAVVLFAVVVILSAHIWTMRKRIMPKVFESEWRIMELEKVIVDIIKEYNMHFDEYHR